MMTAVIRCCVFNLTWAESCRVYSFSGILLVTFFIQRLQTFFLFSLRFFTFLTFFILFWTFFYIYATNHNCHRVTSWRITSFIVYPIWLASRRIEAPWKCLPDNNIACLHFVISLPKSLTKSLTNDKSSQPAHRCCRNAHHVSQRLRVRVMSYALLYGATTVGTAGDWSPTFSGPVLVP